jgi:hypothetical protein
MRILFFLCYSESERQRRSLTLAEKRRRNETLAVGKSQALIKFLKRYQSICHLPSLITVRKFASISYLPSENLASYFRGVRF